jgi:hypothetical protein
MRSLRRFKVLYKAVFFKQYFYISLDDEKDLFMRFVACGYNHFNLQLHGTLRLRQAVPLPQS